MTPVEAYYFALEKVGELQEEGIEVLMKPYRIKEGEVIEVAINGNHIPIDKWVRVTFKFSDENQALKVHKMANYLGLCGMRFDIGGMKKYRDWELDWSFQYTGKEDEEWQDAINWLEEDISMRETL